MSLRKHRSNVSLLSSLGGYFEARLAKSEAQGGIHGGGNRLRGLSRHPIPTFPAFQADLARMVAPPRIERSNEK